MFAEQEFLFDPNESQNRYNRNPLLGLGIGADGLKTGHTQEAGFGLVGSARQGDRRVIFAITGLDTAKARAEESESIVNWAFRQFAEQTVVTKDTAIAEADIWMGAEEKVGLVAQEDLTLLLPTAPVEPLKAEVVYTGPIRAPVTEGQQLAELIIRPEGLEETRLPLFADRAVPAAGFVDRVMTAGQHLLARVQNRPGDAM
jgi:D-alanyl-D-alanine carboxypeptidase (penicillin-binding protein 5/6)